MFLIKKEQKHFSKKWAEIVKFYYQRLVSECWYQHTAHLHIGEIQWEKFQVQGFVWLCWGNTYYFSAFAV